MLSGRIVHRRLRKSYAVSLYQLENFYVETWEDLSKGRIENLVLFKDKTLIKYAFR